MAEVPSASTSGASSLKQAFNKCTAVAASVRVFDRLPTIKLQDLRRDPYAYFVVAFRHVTTKYGRSVVATLAVPQDNDDSEDSSACGATVNHDCFLPMRFAVAITDDYARAYNENPNLKLVFCGVGARNERLVKLIDADPY